MKSRKERTGSMNEKIKNGLRNFLVARENASVKHRNREFFSFIGELKAHQLHSYYRPVSSPAGREVVIWDEYTGKPRNMLMFASNNYLGLANHPFIRKSVKKAIDQYGVGVGGPPLLNGYTVMMEELEERLAHFKQQEDAMIFSSGFSANLGLVTGLARRGDVVIFDSLSHASLFDALRLTNATSVPFEHNDLADLETRLANHQKKANNLFVAIEGVYSMDGDLSPLDQIVHLCKKYKAYCWLDDAHGTGVMGARGRGTAEHFGLEEAIDVSMGTFSKVFSVTGGFLASSRETINYLRYYARSYMFSAALPPMTLAAVLAGLQVIEKHPELMDQLRENLQYAKKKLNTFKYCAHPEAAIIALKVPEWMDIRKANFKIHQNGIFLNAIEYPAVPLNQERFRISLMAQQTNEDIDQLAQCLEEVWQDKSLSKAFIQDPA